MSNWPAFLEAADEDRVAAELVIDSVPRVAAFHTQQAVEKMAKGLLTAKNVDFSKLSNKHSLASLVQLLPSDNEFREDFAKLTYLEAFATTFRYPTPSGKLKPVSDIPGLKTALASIKTLLVDIRVFCDGKPRN